jgi:hypothetical protein
MDRWLHVLLLNVVAGAAFLASPVARAADPPGVPGETPQVVEPRVERRDVTPADIDTENFEAGAFVGTISIEDFGSSVVYGGRAAYHFTEDVYAEATIGTSEAGKTSYEELSGSAELLRASCDSYFVDDSEATSASPATHA